MRKLLAAIIAAVSIGGAVDANAQLTKMTIATGVDPAFSQFYVAKEGGLFEKNGLDVSINTGPSGSAMVPFLVNNQVQAAYGSDLAGVINHQVDQNVVAVADGTYLARWESVVGKNVADLAALKGKKVGIAIGTGSEIFWRRLLDKLGLNPADYTQVNVEAPEMLAAIERGDIDAFAVWEPWPTRTLMSIKGTKVLATAEGVYNNINFVYMNRGWIEQNRHGREVHPRALRGERPDRQGPPGRGQDGVEIPEDADRAHDRADAKGRVRHGLAATLARRHQGFRKAARGPEEAEGAARLLEVRLHGPSEGRAPGERQDHHAAEVISGWAESVCRSSRRAPASGRVRPHGRNPAPLC